MPTFSEFFIEREGGRQSVVIVHFNYVEVGALVFGLFIVLAYLLLLLCARYWPAFQATFVDPLFVRPRQHGRQLHERGALGVPAGRQRTE